MPSRFRYPLPIPRLPGEGVARNPLIRVVIPYTPTKLNPRTQAWGELNGAEFRDVSGDPEDYWRLVEELWTAGKSFMLVEQDNVPPMGAVEGLAACRRRWCLHGYNYGFGEPIERLALLGCTRFSAGLMKAMPLAMSEAVDEQPPFRMPEGQPPRHWIYLSYKLNLRLQRGGLQFHRHHPDTEHHHSRFHILQLAIGSLVASRLGSGISIVPILVQGKLA